MAITVTEKTCTGCGETKPLDAFDLHNQTKTGRHPRCKPCRAIDARRRYERNGPPEREKQRERMIRHRFGIGPDLVHALFESQEGCCAICSQPGGHPIRGERTFKANTLRIDHDHDTGEVRGLLCVNCNSGLGQFGDSSDRLVKAAAYLIERGGQ